MSLTIELEIISDKLDEAMEEIRVFYEDHGDIEEWDWNILESDMLSDKFHKEYGTHSKPFAINFITREED
tara:strand:+ start:952 stop:1161 length:210 start_codon:yes stop_codon:yes gene_type:complete